MKCINGISSFLLFYVSAISLYYVFTVATAAVATQRECRGKHACKALFISPHILANKFRRFGDLVRAPRRQDSANQRKENDDEYKRIRIFRKRMCIIIVHTQPKRKRAHPFVALVFGIFRKFFLQTTCAPCAHHHAEHRHRPHHLRRQMPNTLLLSIWIWFGWSDRLNGYLPCSFVRTKLGQSSMIELICTQSLLGWLQTYNNAFYFRCESIERKDETTNYLIFLSTFFDFILHVPILPAGHVKYFLCCANDI